MSSVQQRDLPERLGVCAQIAVSIERVDTVVLGGHEYHIVLGACLWRSRAHRDVRHIQRLGVYVPIYNIIKDFSECAGIHIGRRQNRLGGIGAGASIVVVLSGHVLRLGTERKEQQCPGRAKNQARAHFFYRVQGRHAVLLRLSQLWQKLDGIGYCRCLVALRLERSLPSSRLVSRLGKLTGETSGWAPDARRKYAATTQTTAPNNRT